MRIPSVVFMGEKPLAAWCFNDLVQRKCRIAGICTRAFGDEVWWGEERLYLFAGFYNYPIIQREDIIKLSPDIIISVLYPFIIEKEVLDSANRAFNLHLAPLPEYKGKFCGSHALMRGEKQFGVTLHKMTPSLDSGEILEKAYFRINITDNAWTLYERAVEVAKKVWLNNIEAILSNHYKTQHVPDDGSLPFDKHSLDNKQIPKTLDRLSVYNFARALDFEWYEPAYFLLNGKKVYLKQKDFNLLDFSLKDTELEQSLVGYLKDAPAEKV